MQLQSAADLPLAPSAKYHSYSRATVLGQEAVGRVRFSTQGLQSRGVFAVSGPHAVENVSGKGGER